jgi:hypothetical protein
MIVIASLAISWSMFTGIAHISVYRANVGSESLYRREILEWEAIGGTRQAADRRRQADELARANQISRAYGATALSLAVMGVVLGGLALVLRQRPQEQTPARHRVDAIAGACSLVSAVILVGFALGCTAFLAALAFVGATCE